MFFLTNKHNWGPRYVEYDKVHYVMYIELHEHLIANAQAHTIRTIVVLAAGKFQHKIADVPLGP